MERMLTVRISERLVKYLDILARVYTEMGKPTTRSELIRQAIVEFLKKKLHLLKIGESLEY